MRLTIARNESASALVVTISVIATILVLLGGAVEYTQHVSRVADRTRKAARALEIADGHLEFLFTHWRNIYRLQNDQKVRLSTNYFFTDCATCDPNYNGNPGPAVSGGNPGTPPIIPLPAASAFAEDSYTVTQYRIQAVDPMIRLDSTETTLVQDASKTPPMAYGPNPEQLSTFYLAAVDVTVQSMTGPVTAKVRRVFERKNDNPWTFAMLYHDDLEFQPGTSFTITGPIQTNSSLYIGTSNFKASDKVLYSGEYQNDYSPKDPRFGSTALSSPKFPYGLSPMQDAPLLPFGWNLALDATTGNNESYRELIERPVAGTNDELGTDPKTTRRFYTQAGIKVTIAENNSITVRNASNQIVTSSSGGNDKQIHATITAALTTNRAMLDNREGVYVRLVDVDVGKITADVNAGKLSGFNGVIYISDVTANGQSVTSTITGTSTTVTTKQRGIRLVNAALLPNTGVTFPDGTDRGGLAFASENPVYIQGSYNTGFNPPSNGSPGDPTKPTGTTTSTGSTAYGFLNSTDNKRYPYPALVVGDVINVLSPNWTDKNSTEPLPGGSWSSTAPRAGTSVTINTALVSGNVPSDGSTYSGGGENFLRLQEDFRTQNFTYYGSMVQLYKSRQATAPLTAGGQLWKSPAVTRWFYDSNLGGSNPPGNLQLASYLQQQRWYQVY